MCIKCTSHRWNARYHNTWIQNIGGTIEETTANFTLVTRALWEMILPYWGPWFVRLWGHDYYTISGWHATGSCEKSFCWIRTLILLDGWSTFKIMGKQFERYPMWLYVIQSFMCGIPHTSVLVLEIACEQYRRSNRILTLKNNSK